MPAPAQRFRRQGSGSPSTRCDAKCSRPSAGRCSCWAGNIRSAGYVPHLLGKRIRRVSSKGGWLKFAPTWLFLMLYLFHQSSAAQAGTSAVPDANPGRPTVSTPAALTPVGYLQFENGTLFADNSTEFSTRFGVSQVIKLTVLPRLELFLQRSR